MDALVAVHKLGHSEIQGKGAEHVGVLSREPGDLAEQGYHLPYRLLGRIVQVRVEPERDKVCRGLRPRLALPCPPMQDELERARKRCFDRGDVDLAVTLCRVTVADRE